MTSSFSKPKLSITLKSELLVEGIGYVLIFTSSILFSNWVSTSISEITTSLISSFGLFIIGSFISSWTSFFLYVSTPYNFFLTSLSTKFLNSKYSLPYFSFEYSGVNLLFFLKASYFLSLSPSICALKGTDISSLLSRP